ncbi:hypothetical protein DPMN_006517 [Dreissena polymorpha]|uniref:Uncharacterized protein n=1 Tax=Dreissena polymorpha TaxID=45954 RepID=A0A9D4MSJ6_DREPO|nr:hypothetical protein DPMN_006517 [Dreissena polymorpha]
MEKNSSLFTGNDIFEIQNLVLSAGLDGKPVDLAGLNRLMTEGIELNRNVQSTEKSQNSTFKIMAYTQKVNIMLRIILKMKVPRFVPPGRKVRLTHIRINRRSDPQPPNNTNSNSHTHNDKRTDKRQIHPSPIHPVPMSYSVVDNKQPLRNEIFQTKIERTKSTLVRIQ